MEDSFSKMIHKCITYEKASSELQCGWYALTGSAGVGMAGGASTVTCEPQVCVVAMATIAVSVITMTITMMRTSTVTVVTVTVTMVTNVAVETVTIMITTVTMIQGGWGAKRSTVFH